MRVRHPCWLNVCSKWLIYRSIEAPEPVNLVNLVVVKGSTVHVQAPLSNGEKNKLFFFFTELWAGYEAQSWHLVF